MLEWRRCCQDEAAQAIRSRDLAAAACPRLHRLKLKSRNRKNQPRITRITRILFFICAIREIRSVL